MSYIIPVKHERDSLFEWKSPLHLLDDFGFGSHKQNSTTSSSSSTVKGDFEVELDVSGFSPHEVEVKVSGREVLVHCLHEDSGNRREVNRSYRLPEGVDPKTVRSHLSRGMLTVTAHSNAKDYAAAAPVQHKSPIQQTMDKFGVGSLFGGKKPDFDVELDVHSYEPHEIDVKVHGNEVVVHCLHEGKEFGQVVKREINRSYRLPDDIDPYSVKSQLSHGKLTVTASRKHF